MTTDANSSAPISDGLILLAGLIREPASTRPLVFGLVLLFYTVAVVGNSLLIGAIYRDASLHRPMFLLLANLALSDIVGCSATLPRIMHDLAAPNLISVAECIAQTIAIHFYRALECFVLSAMALDRYAAICRPLRYHALATNARALALNAAALAASAAAVAPMLALQLRLNVSSCDVRKAIPSAYCDVMGLVRISCSDGSASNAVAVAVAVVTVGGSAGVVAFSYASILYECSFKRSRAGKVAAAAPASNVAKAGTSAFTTATGTRMASTSTSGRDKALETCVTHVLVLTVFYAPLLFVIVYNRVDKLFPIPDTTRSALTCLFYTAPPALNPVIYGLRTAAIRRAVAAMMPCWWRQRGKGARGSTVSLVPRAV